MTAEVQVKRTVYVAECKGCGERDIKDKDPPRERMCGCGLWVGYEPQSYVGPDRFGGGK